MQTVCVTGASGFIAGHIVKELLEKGYTVRGTVRDAANPEKTQHLTSLPGAAERLTLFSASLQDTQCWDAPIAGCWGVVHVASPIPVEKPEDQEKDIVKPAVEGTLNVLGACARAGVQRVVQTSSMAAVAPVPAPEVKSEEHWSDPDSQRSRDSYYGASKTLAERAAWDFVDKQGDGCFRLVTVCPTMILGPMLQPGLNATMLGICKRFKEGLGGECRDDSMSMVDVRDCAAQHVACLESDSASGRYMSLKESWHWNELDAVMSEIYPARPKSTPVAEPCMPTQFDCTKQVSLGVEVRSIPDILRGAAEELRAKGHLD